jgi:hypothetical protein
MPKAFYVWTRDLHLYIGLFVSPFLIVFAASVFFVNHVPVSPADADTAVETFSDLQVPEGIEQARDMDRVRLAQSVLPQLGVVGEINFIRLLPEERRLVIPVVRPGVEATIDLNIAARTAKVSRRRIGLGETISYLHRSPGPHNVSIRGNWFWTGAWRWVADATVYLILFLSVSGIYLWAALRSERRIGLMLLAAGAVSFFGIVYAVVY